MTENSVDFIRQMIREDIESGLNGGQVYTRFPPEPNGYLQIGHAKAICLNFEIAKEFNGKCNLRFDDTNPEKESVEFVEAIKKDLIWLGYSWDKLCYASDYFQTLYEWAHQLIKSGDAYVDESDPETIKLYRGTLRTPGTNSVYRNRSISESTDLFKKMRAGKFEDGSMVLRAKIDMSHPNMNMRDPIMYRIKKFDHHRLKDAWPIYPSYDFAHGQSDSIEGITHSLCSLEFEDHRPLYDWFIKKLKIFPSKQTEFARMNLTYNILSKRKLRELVESGLVDAWDDPRMPTLSGMRKRGYPAEAIRDFCKTAGVTKVPSTSDVALLEHSVRNVLNRDATRRMAIFNPLEIEIINWDNSIKILEAPLNPENKSQGTRKIPFGKIIWIDRNDFREEANRKFHRLKLGGEVRLRHSFVIKCNEVIKGEDGEIKKLICHADLNTLGKNPEDRKVKGVIHWLHRDSAVKAKVRKLDRLFTEEQPDIEDPSSFKKCINKNSSKESICFCEPSVINLKEEETCQFERIGYFCRESNTKVKNDTDKCLIYFNETIGLKGDFKG